MNYIKAFWNVMKAAVDFVFGAITEDEFFDELNKQRASIGKPPARRPK